MPPEILAELQHRPGQARILGGNDHHRPPIAPPLHQAPRPATEAVLLVSQAAGNGTRPHDQQAAQVAVAGPGDPPPPGGPCRRGCIAARA